MVSPLEVVPRFAEVKQALAAISPRCGHVVFASGHAVDVLVSALLERGDDARALDACKLGGGGRGHRAPPRGARARADLVGRAGGLDLADEIRRGATWRADLVPARVAARGALRASWPRSARR